MVCAGDKHSVSKGPCVNNRGVLITMSTSVVGKGGGVLDKPIIEKTTPGRESEFDLRYTFAYSASFLSSSSWTVYYCVILYCCGCSGSQRRWLHHTG